MLDEDLRDLFENLEKLEALSQPFARAYRNNMFDEANRLSRQAFQCINTIVIRIRNFQEEGRAPQGAENIGKWRRLATESDCNEAIKLKYLSAGDPLPLREALNKFAHVKKSNFTVDPEHRMILCGIRDKKWWIVDFSMQDFCSAARDVASKTLPAH